MVDINNCITDATIENSNLLGLLENNADRGATFLQAAQRVRTLNDTYHKIQPFASQFLKPITNDEGDGDGEIASKSSMSSCTKRPRLD